MFALGGVVYMRIKSVPSITASGGGSMNAVVVGGATPGVPLSVDIQVGGLVHCPRDAPVAPVTQVEVTLP